MLTFEPIIKTLNLFHSASIDQVHQIVLGTFDLHFFHLCGFGCNSIVENGLLFYSVYESISSSSSSYSLSSHMESQNEELLLQQLFKLPKCYGNFSQMKSYCTLFSRLNYYFWPDYLSFFFFCPFFHFARFLSLSSFFFFLLCSPLCSLTLTNLPHGLTIPTDLPHGLTKPTNLLLHTDFKTNLRRSHSISVPGFGWVWWVLIRDGFEIGFYLRWVWI